MFGNSLAILVPWLFVVWWTYGNGRQRRWFMVAAVLAFVSIVSTLDRGLWVAKGKIKTWPDGNLFERNP